MACNNEYHNEFSKKVLDIPVSNSKFKRKVVHQLQICVLSLCLLNRLSLKINKVLKIVRI